MNRENKYRGFVKELNSFVYGDLLKNNGQPIIVKQVDRNYISTTDVGQGKHWAIEVPAYKVAPESVGQFTGLHDKNGVEIYEGDWIQSAPGYASVIQFKDGAFLSIYSHPEDGEELLITDLDISNIEVFGNIYK